jgi:uncharacterized membrane protein (DUF106 family)
MLDLWNTVSLAIGDFILGWALRLPRDLTLVIVALATALLMIGVRRFTTPQDRLRRAAEDNRQLKQLAREARRNGDKPALQRYKTTRNLISVIKLKAEGLPLVVSLLPIALLATWAMFRLEYPAVAAREAVTLAVFTPVGAADDVIHVVPEPDVEVEPKPTRTWVRKIQAVTDDGPAHGLATWTLRAKSNPQPYTLTIRWKDRSFERELIVGQTIYALPVVDHGGEVLSEWQREPYRWLGLVPGVLGLPAWLIGYIILVVPAALLLKRVFGVY